MSFVRPLSNMSPKGLLVSGHLMRKITCSFVMERNNIMVGSKQIKSALLLHHADVMDKLQGEGQQFVVGVGSKQTVIHNLRRKV